MGDYKKILSEIVVAVAEVKDDKLREIAFAKLLDDALGMKQGLSEKVSTPVATGADNPDRMPLRQKKVSKRRLGSKPYSEESVRDEVKSAFEGVTPKQPGLKPYKDLKMKWERYLWALEVGHLKGLEAMTNNEVAYVLGYHFSEGITEKQVNNLTQKTGGGFVQRTEVNGLKGWRILADGEAMLKEESGG